MPYTRRGAHAHLGAHRPRARAAGPRPRRSCTTWCWRTPCSGLFCRTGRAFPRLIPSLNRTLARADERLRAPRREQPRVRERAPGPVHGDGVRAAARARRRGARAGAGADRAPPPADRLPDRAPRDRAGRRAALDRPRPADRLHRGAPVRGDGVRDLLPRGRGDHGRLRRPPPLGQAPLPDRPPRCAPATPSGTASRRSATASTRSAASRTTTCAACSRAAAQGPVQREPAAVLGLREHA